MTVKSTKNNRQVSKNKNLNKKTKKKLDNPKQKSNPIVKKEVRPDGVTEDSVRKIMTCQIKNKIGRYFPKDFPCYIKRRC